jgi:hypothetical protein
MWINSNQTDRLFDISHVMQPCLENLIVLEIKTNKQTNWASPPSLKHPNKQIQSFFDQTNKQTK